MWTKYINNKCEILQEGKIYEWLFGMHEDYHNSLFRVATI